MIDLVLEAAVNFAALVVGRQFVGMAALGRRLGRTPIFGFSLALGVALVVVFLSLTTMFGVNSPWTLLSGLVFLSGYAASRTTVHELVETARAIPIFALAAVLAAVGARLLRAGVFTWDSLYLIGNARLAAQNRLYLVALEDPELFESFPLGYSFLQIPSAWYGHAANFSVGVLAILGTVGILLWELRDKQQTLPFMSAIAVLGLMLGSRFLWMMGSYINSHSLVALLLLVAYLLLQDVAYSGYGLIPLAVVFSALVILRVENVIVVTLLLVMTSGLRAATPERVRVVRIAYFSIGVTSLVYQAIIVRFYLLAGQQPSASSIGLLGFGVLTLVVGLSLPWLLSWYVPEAHHFLLGVAGLNVLYAVIDLESFMTSLSAVVQNLVLYRGGWGLLPGLLAGLSIAAWWALSITRGEREVGRLLEFCAAAVLFFFFTGFLRDLPFRVGEFDSFNRQLTHVVPLLLVAVARAIGGLGANSSWQGEAQQ